MNKNSQDKDWWSSLHWIKKFSVYIIGVILTICFLIIKDIIFPKKVEQISESIPKKEMLFNEFYYQQRLGNPAVQGHDTDGSQNLFKKKLGTSVGSTITIKDFFLWKHGSTDWEKGGKLQIYNDNSMGYEYAISCYLEPSEGDKIMSNPKRRLVDISGVIFSYTSFSGLLINPCKVTWDELDGPKK